MGNKYPAVAQHVIGSTRESQPLGAERWRANSRVIGGDDTVMLQSERFTPLHGPAANSNVQRDCQNQ